MLSRFLVVLIFLFTGTAQAQNYPSRPVKLVVPFSAGGTTDIVARALAQKLSESLGQPFVVENRPGAGGMVGMDMVAKSPPDGYTLVLGSTSSVAVNVSLYANLPYNPERDLVPVTQVATGPYFVGVYPGLPAKNIAELVALSKAKPGALNFGSSGNGTALHLAGELLKNMAAIDMTHVAYKGVGAAMPDLLAGRIQLMFSDMPAYSSYLKAGTLRVIAVTSSKRSSLLPDLPTIAESGVPGYEATSWYGILGPAGMPRELILKLNREIIKIMRLPEIRERYSGLGIEAVDSTPEQFGAYIASETKRWATVVKQSGLAGQSAK